MSVLCCFLICSADLYTISLCLLKHSLLSPQSLPAELMPPPVELGHLAPSIPTWCKKWQAWCRSRMAMDRPPSAAASLARLGEPLFPRPGVLSALCLGLGTVLPNTPALGTACHALVSRLAQPSLKCHRGHAVPVLSREEIQRGSG